MKYMNTEVKVLGMNIVEFTNISRFYGCNTVLLLLILCRSCRRTHFGISLANFYRKVLDFERCET